ncbi:sigma-70 family RNA polymerase sigma factor, partial [Clostridioides difficile]|uniref:sigma-70 family RNA polymerase sigma factor n=1 Tax=Clostridioides difficile TaxID=1496 RepID=UPI001F420739
YRRFFKNFSLFLAKQKVACIIPRKGEVLPPFGRKEVNTMTPNRREFEKQCAFQKFCKSVLHNEACNAHEEIRRRRVREVAFSDLTLHEERQLYTVDKYFQDEEAEPSYQMAGKEITPKLLLEAIRALPEERRKIVLLYYFEGLTDIEIGKQLNISRSTVQYRQTSSFEQLKKYLEENADEWIEW